MLLRLRSDLPTAELDSILFACKELGYEPRFLDEGHRLLSLEGPGRPGDACALSDHRGVKEVLDAEGARLLAERASAASELRVDLPLGGRQRGPASLGARI